MVTRFSLLLTIIILSACSVLKKDPTKGNPPGTLKINDTLFIDQTEMTNIAWREYLYYLGRFDSTNSFKALPDTLAWRKLLVYGDPIVEYYFRHPGFNNYPVVGISYEQAIEYCQWRTFIVNLGMYLDENNLQNFEEHLNDPFPIKFYYRLPKKEEWEMIASGKLPLEEFPYGYKDVYHTWKGKRARSFNCIFPGERLPFTFADSLNDEIYTYDVKANYPNTYGTYNMIGNLSEMVLEKGVAKGGSFAHPLDSCKILLDQRYEEPEVWLGFRCVAIKLK